ncbi:DNA alkylation repair protein [Motilimonas pumila]|uniref:DNA alkylation repair protein n=1 Tax=Motilimonas pumila TaxID=2303987 RepID=A0A418YDQ8_9GAMM|nr:DNA alkylation repair protein [Motilimonas pumila]RJG42657.1 DNA alkylation repair protein [Motilimonas pumila]
MATALKEHLSETAVNRISQCFERLEGAFLQQCGHPFDAVSFKQQALSGLEALSLKQRVKHLIAAIHHCLPADFLQAAAILQQAPAAFPVADAEDKMAGFAAWPLIDYVADYGLAHPQVALDTLATLTRMFSAEFAVRPFIEKYPQQTLAQMLQWTQHKDEHVRRLASEGCRPRLPWGLRLQQFVQDPEPIIPILTQLNADPSLYVRRSVANNLNDISKDHPQRVIELCQQWQLLQQDQTDWLIRHACRSLVKQGMPAAFSLLGYSEQPQIELSAWQADNHVAMGQGLAFSFALTGLAPSQKAVIDYCIHFVKANGQLSPKVFKLKNVHLQQGQQMRVGKQHSFKAISTRKYYPGEHLLTVHCNGQELARWPFQLTE